MKFCGLIAAYLTKIWYFLIFIGQLSGVIVVLVRAILWFTDVKSGKGKWLVLIAILLSIIVEYFVLFPPGFVLG